MQAKNLRTDKEYKKQKMKYFSLAHMKWYLWYQKK